MGEFSYGAKYEMTPVMNFANESGDRRKSKRWKIEKKLAISVM